MQIKLRLITNVEHCIVCNSMKTGQYNTQTLTQFPSDGSIHRGGTHICPALQSIIRCQEGKTTLDQRNLDCKVTNFSFCQPFFLLIRKLCVLAKNLWNLNDKAFVEYSKFQIIWPWSISKGMPCRFKCDQLLGKLTLSVWLLYPSFRLLSVHGSQLKQKKFVNTKSLVIT